MFKHTQKERERIKQWALVPPCQASVIVNWAILPPSLLVPCFFFTMLKDMLKGIPRLKNTSNLKARNENENLILFPIKMKI